MGEFADAIHEAQDNIAAESTTSAPDAPPTSTTSEESPGPAPSSPETSSPETAPAPTLPVGAPTPPRKMVDLGALHEARSQVKQLRERYSWLPPDERSDRLKQFWTAYGKDPVGTILGELDGLASAPETRQRILQALGGLIEQAQPPADDPEPQPDYRLPDGTLFMSESRRAEWRQWDERRRDNTLNEKLEPFQRYLQSAQQREALQQAQGKATESAKELFTEMRQYPHFDANREAIREKFVEFSEKMDGRAALYRAYLDVLHRSVMPNLSRQERSAVAADLQRRAGATTPNPARPTAAGGSKAPEDFRDAAIRLLSPRAS